jgi:predicted PurR-regulated permease PerM
MASRGQPPVNVSFATFFKAVLVAALVWAWLYLWQWVLVFVLAAFMAVALDPAVKWLDGRGVRRRYAAPLLVLMIAAAVVAFVALSAASLTEDAQDLTTRLRGFASDVMNRLPAEAQRLAASLAPSPSALVSVGRGLVGGLAGVAFALVVTVYLLLDGRRTYQWLVAFVPARARGRAHQTAECAREVVTAYMHGNCVTSLLTAVFTWIALTVMQVPAALLLALLAGLFDFVPVIGFLLSAAPAVLLGFAVSPMTALGVAIFYVVYNLVENYYIQPMVYGKEMDLSSLAVIGAFLVGGTLGGVLGALISLPVAALYPSIERLWFDRPGDDDTADEHARIQQQPEH